MRLPSSLLLLASSFCSALALDLKGQILWNDVCPGKLCHHTEGQARVQLDDGRLHSGITRDGRFTIPNVPKGIYILEVVAHDHVFDKLRIDVVETELLPEVRPYIPGTPLSPPAQVLLSYPIVLYARAAYDFYIPRQSFNVLAMFQNPMMLMMVFTGVMVLAMPYLMKNMDPEALQDFGKHQSKIAEVQNAFQSGDIKSGFSAIMNSGEEEPRSSGSAPAARQGTPTSRNRAPKNKRR
ncbi:hypothetical protein EUX98_g31 [Antrodiella citrinella]|uniref:ER membrane protein complex subunit 7 beta-sandwich domain-containing protein n=1 Tax=Antrodiella citrinella TaxID=2447956 RepID=A0A4S4N4X9_9APHY|nr:hypothetical protein EUX98_g31 [Antrodiella citrinella]